MVHRVSKTASLGFGLSGILYLMLAMPVASLRGPVASVPLTAVPVAQAQSPQTQLRYVVAADRSEARYRIREQLAGVNFPNDAIGTTKAIEGRVAFDAQGQVLTGDSRLTVDLRTLQSDRDRRDNYVRRNTLETDRYPTAVFVPTEMRGLPFPLLPTGTATFELVGNFTVRDVTRRISWQATATFTDQEVNVQARTAFRFADFGLSIPRVASVLSVEDNIQLEADLLLRRSS
jgi:polyisoprenoid-binding protein YceI